MCDCFFRFVLGLSNNNNLTKKSMYGVFGCKINISVAVRHPIVAQFREKRTFQSRRQGIRIERAIENSVLHSVPKDSTEKSKYFIKSMFSLLSGRMSETELVLNPP